MALRATSAKTRWTRGSQRLLSGVKNSLVRRKRKKPVQVAAHVRMLSYSEGLDASDDLILAKMPIVIGR